LLETLKSSMGHPFFMKYFKNTSWLFAEKLLRMVVGFFVGVWVARYLGPKQYGLFSYAQSFVGLFSALATVGLDGIIVRELVKDEKKRDALLGTSFVLKLIGAVLVLLVLFVAINFSSNDAYTNILVFIIASATIFQSFNVIDFYFQSKILSKFVVYSNIISLLVSSLVKIFLILYEAPLLAFALTILFDSLVLSLGYIYFYSRNDLSVKRWRFHMPLALDLLKDSWPAVFSSMVLMLQARIDQVMLKEMLGSTEVGYYSIALRLIEAFAFLTLLVKISYSPAIIEAKNGPPKLYEKRLLFLYRLNFSMFLLVGIPVFFFADSIVSFLLGSEYHSSGLLLSLMAIRLFFANMGTARSVYILTENLFKFSLVTTAIGTAVNIALNYFWITRYGSKGAIFATIVSFAVTIFVFDFFYKKTRVNAYLMIKGIFSFFKIFR
jgi:O-antigen/teichoic acid export membrane protein